MSNPVCWRPVGKEVVVVMENESRYKSYKKNRETLLHKYNGAYHVHESELSESCPLEDPSNVDEPPAVTVRGRLGRSASC